MLLEYIPQHDYFVDKIEVVSSKQNNRPFNIKPDGGIEKLRSFTFDILQGLEYIHSLNIIHMDLKPANLMILNYYDEHSYPLVKICDFGLSRRFQPGESGVVIEKKCGTDKFIAPEVCDNGFVTPMVDMWCFGIILHTLTVGYTPYVLK